MGYIHVGVIRCMCGCVLHVGVHIVHVGVVLNTCDLMHRLAYQKRNEEKEAKELRHMEERAAKGSS